MLYTNTDFEYLQGIARDLEDITFDMDVSYSSNRYIEFNHQGVNKGAGLKKLAALLHIDIEDTMAIGDNYNDLSMIMDAGLGVGVQNAAPGIKPDCDYITQATCEQGAVCEAIEKFVLKGE